jgi:hypothetical protein
MLCLLAAGMLATTARAITSPTEIANLQMWLDASDASMVVTNAGGKVSEWSDKSSAGTRDAVQATDANRPTKALDALNRPVIRFTGGTSLEVAGANEPLAAGDNFTIFTVGTWASCVRGQDGWGDGWSVNPGAVVTVVPGAAQYVVSRTPSAVGMRIDCLRLDQTSPSRSLSRYMNGAAATTNTSVGASLRSSTRSFILNGADFAEFIIYNRALTPAERQDVEKYLAAKWKAYLPMGVRATGGT